MRYPRVAVIKMYDNNYGNVVIFAQVLKHEIKVKLISCIFF